MISDQFALQLRPVLAAQRDVLARLTAEISAVEVSLDALDAQAVSIAELDALLREIEDDVGSLDDHDLDDFDAEAVPELFAQRTALIRLQVGIAYTDWSSFVRQCRAYDAEHGIDPLTPYESFLTTTDVARLRRESYEEQYRWDSWDYIAVGLAGTLAALTDFLLVRIPTSMKYMGEFEQKGSPLTEWVKKYDTRAGAGQKDWFARWAQQLEKEAKVPFDRMHAVFGDEDRDILGMGGRTHRFQSLGHDPVLGFVFGVYDILRGTITGFSYDKLTGRHEFFSGQVWSNSEPIGLIKAFLTQIKHLLSDVATPMGLPAPFLPLAQAFKLGGFGPKERSLGELARWMYQNGYDLRHFLVGGIGPALVEITLRAFIMIRHYIAHGEVKFIIGGHPKYRLMLLAAHGAAAVANAGKVVLYQGNPLAINEAQWLAFGRYLLPSLKYWLFDRDRLKWEHLERITDVGWAELEAHSAAVMESVAVHHFPLVELGREAE